jgi:hypothetical protein
LHELNDAETRVAYAELFRKRQAGPMNDHRQNKRFRTLKEGRIIDPQGRTTLDCTIRDISLTGARVQLVSAINIPEDFELLIVREDMIIPARRRWQRGTSVGLEFTGPSRRLVGGR